ncbi:hypothetical protein ACSBR1_014292 [Camellia fascicularis]
MNDNLLGYDEWLQRYQETIAGQVAQPGGLSHDATVVTTRASTDPNMLSSSSSGTSSGNPKGSISKPIRRRSRVSKRTPITLLKANATNFRALVQQFTGCRVATTLSFGARTGPVNLNFAMGSQHSDITANNSMKGSFEYNFNDRQTQTQTQTQIQIQQQKQQEQQHCHHHQQQMYDQEKQCIVSSENISPSDGYASTCSNPTTPNILEDLVLDNISLYELIGDA